MRTVCELLLSTDSAAISEFRCENCSLERIDSGVFSSTPSLIKLMLRYNQLTQVPVVGVQYCIFCENAEIDLGFNKISQIGEFSFPYKKTSKV